MGSPQQAINGGAVRIDPPRAVEVEQAPAETAIEAVAAAAVSLLAQCAAVVEAVNDEAYRTASRTIRGGTIGKHMRHVLDHFRAAVSCAEGGGCIDYDHRERDVPMETERAEAVGAINRLAISLRGLNRATLASPVRVRVIVDAEGATVELKSTLARELAFAAHHAVHHHAMVRAIAAELGHDLPEDLGRAPSTLHHERRLAGGSRSGG